MKPGGAIRRRLIPGLAAAPAGTLTAACSRGAGEPEGPRPLRIGIMYGSADDDYHIRQTLTDAFELTMQGAIEIEIVPAINCDQYQFLSPEEQQNQPDVYEEVKKLLTGPNPVDVMVLDSSLLALLARDNLLVQLDPLMAEDNINKEDFVPAVIDAIAEMGDGFIYALTPTFNPSALFYNKKLFQEAGVEFPTDHMTWDDVFNLARRLKRGEGRDAVWGFTFNEWGSAGGFWELQQFVQPLNLRMYDDGLERMTVNNDSWKTAWETIAQLYKDKVLPTDELMMGDKPEDGVWHPYMDRAFFRGKVAMVLGNYSFISELVNFNNNAVRLRDWGFEPIDWDVVTVPSHSSAPGVSGNIHLSQLLAINANAQNREDAWTYIKFMTGEEWAKLVSRSPWELPARKAYIRPRSGLSYNIEAFYSVKPAPPRPYAEQKLERDYPNVWRIRDIGKQLFGQVLQGEKTVEEALAEWESRGNDLLPKIRENPNGPIEGVFDDFL
ncbi:MAG TPA: extracellular solute-binding protein [Paenibacillaceae bacterium]